MLSAAGLSDPSAAPTADGPESSPTKRARLESPPAAGISGDKAEDVASVRNRLLAKIEEAIKAEKSKAAAVITSTVTELQKGNMLTQPAFFPNRCRALGRAAAVLWAEAG